jgi:hypothetical protein
LNDHYDGKDPLTHVAKKQAEGIFASSETHGTETPGAVIAFGDTLREICLSLSLLFLILTKMTKAPLFYLFIFGFGFILWKTGRSAFLSWSRLERLHRLLNEELFEIEHEREQEKEELTLLYQARGFEGKLLQDAVEVLMADKDRALKVMLEEELNLTLESQEHPLKQAFGAFLGGVTGLFLVCLYPPLALLGVGAGTYLLALFEKNHSISAVVWNLSLFGLSFASVYFLLML